LRTVHCLMSEEEQKKTKELDIPSPFEDLPLPRQKRIRRSVYFGSIVFLLLVAALVAGLYAYTSHKKRQAAAEWHPPGIPVKIIELEPVDLDEIIEATGVIQPHQEVTVTPEVSGKVIRIEADMGDTVAKDAPLVVLDDELIRLKVKQIRAQITKLTAMCEDAEKNLKRKEKLFRRKTISETDLDQAILADQTNQGLLAETAAQLDMALYELRHTTVRSPIPGNVTERYLEVGSLASPQVPVARIVNIEKARVVVGLIDEDVKRVRMGQEVVLKVDAFPEQEFVGRVTAIGSQADAHTLTFPVRVEWENAEDPVWPGMISRLSIKVEHHAGVIVVPREIIRDEGDRLAVFVVVDSLARKRTLTLGPRIKDMVIVSSGLEPGDRVVCVGHEILDDGLKVQIDTGD